MGVVSAPTKYTFTVSGDRLVDLHLAAEQQLRVFYGATPHTYSLGPIEGDDIDASTPAKRVRIQNGAHATVTAWSLPTPQETP